MYDGFIDVVDNIHLSPSFRYFLNSVILGMHKSVFTTFYADNAKICQQFSRIDQYYTYILSYTQLTYYFKSAGIICLISLLSYFNPRLVSKRYLT